MFFKIARFETPIALYEILRENGTWERPGKTAARPPKLSGRTRVSYFSIPHCVNNA
jgi:hypothetical protein